MRVIAIDGPAGAGKSTVARQVSTATGLRYLDTGAMYRAVTLFCFRKGFVSKESVNQNAIINHLNQIEIHFERNKETLKLEIFLNKEVVEREIRSLEISSLVSKVASIKEVRQKLVVEQKKMGEKGGVVMDGRDIGSVVFPNAELKLFITASSEIRTDRRFKELLSIEPNITREEIRQNLEERDYLDSTRSESPLIQTEDAVVIDNSDINQQEQLELALELVRTRMNG